MPIMSKLQVRAASARGKLSNVRTRVKNRTFFGQRQRRTGSAGNRIRSRVR